MKKILAIVLACLTLSACNTLPYSTSNTYNGVSYDQMQYGQLVGMRWLTGILRDQCKDESVVLANFRVLKGKSEEIQIYVQHKKSSYTEVRLANQLNDKIKFFEKQYRETRNEAECREILSSMMMTLDSALDTVSGKNNYPTPSSSTVQ